MLQFDRAFVNGTIYTMQAPGARAEAMLVHGGRLLAVGTNEEIGSYPVKERVDLGGRTVLPGLIDTHCHIPEMVDDSRKVDLSGARSIQDVVARMAAGLKTLKKGKWLIGRGLSSALLAEGRLPNRYDLDRITRDVPVYIMTFDGHSNMGNSRLLEVAGIGKGYRPGEGEILEFDADGEPTGIFKETAISSRILKQCPPLYADDGEAGEAIRQCLLDSARMGYTTLHTILGLWPSMLGRARLYQELARAGRLPVRLGLCYCGCYENPMNAVSGLGDERVRLGACKFFADGAMSEGTAYLSQDYQDRPGCRGSLMLEAAELRRRVETAYRLGNDVCIHIIGDAALDVVLELLEAIYDPASPSHFELIHCAVTRPDQLERMKKLPVVVLKQPIFIQAPTTLRGEEKLGGLNRWYHGLKSFLDAGIPVAGGTDGPLADMDPIRAIACAVGRRAFDKTTVVNPQERIDAYSAVGMFTRDAALVGHEEGDKGTLEAGKLADFIVLDRDIFQMVPEGIADIKVLKTYLGGVPVYQ